MFTLSLLILNVVLERVDIYNSSDFLRFIDNIEWGFLFPVFIFLFIVHEVNHPTKYSKKILLLFIPFLYSFIINVFNDLHIIPNIYKNSIKNIIEIKDILDFLLFLLFIPFMAIYSFHFIKFSKNKKEKKWITFLWVIVFSLLFSWILAILTGLIFQYDISLLMTILVLFASVLIHCITYLGVFKYKLAIDKESINVLLNNKLPTDSFIYNDESNLKKENNSELLTKENLYFKKLEFLCKNHQIYRDSNLNREAVAKELGISSGYVSQIINTITGNNFTNYINNYRVEAVKEMILDSEFNNYNLLAIGLESGFTSKTTFYKAFKKATGMTPNEYKQANK